MKEDLQTKYALMSIVDLQSEITKLQDESHTLTNLIDKVKFEGLYDLDRAGIENLTSKLKRKKRFINHCYNVAARVLGAKNAEIKRLEHEKSINSDFELFKKAAKSILPDNLYESVYSKFITLCEVEK